MTVATVTAIVGATVAIASAATAGSASAKSKAAARAAEAVAARKLKSAKKELQRMEYQGLSLDLEGYRQEQESSQVAAAMAIDAGQQADGRTLAAVAGRAQMADIEQQRQARVDKGTRLDALDKIKADERKQVHQQMAGLDLAEAQGAQIAAAEADVMAQKQQDQAITSGVQAVGAAANLYSSVQGAYDPNGVKGTVNKNIGAADADQTLDIQDFALDNLDLLPSGYKLPDNFGSYSNDELMKWGNTTFTNRADARAFFDAFQASPY
tara:strand:- start:25266 stop:26066 length:801 start_codon:yes stop_codon:yes gene_type:complete